MDLASQDRKWFDSAYCQEIEAPLDACWLLDAMVGRTIGFVHLSRPRGARPFSVDDVQRLDRLRPWFAHAFRRVPWGGARSEDQDPLGAAGAVVRSGQLIVTADARLVYQTASLESLLNLLMGKPSNYTRYVPLHDRLCASRATGRASQLICAGKRKCGETHRKAVVPQRSYAIL
jgi:hypothetical protein